MLERLSVRDFALIDRIEIEFPEGLTVFTGETGAGKSLLVGAIGFLFGAKVDAGVIRTGAQECSVSGIVLVDEGSPAARWLEEHGIGVEDGSVVLRRGLKANGRSNGWIQDRAVTRSDLADFTAQLADIHGQNEHQRLLRPETHLGALDRFAGLGPDMEGYSALYAEWTALKAKLREAAQAAARRDREIDFLKFSVEELKKSKVRPGEDDELLGEERILVQHEKLHGMVDQASASLSGQQDGAVAGLRRSKAALEAAKAIDPRLEETAGRISDAFYEIEDAAEALKSYIDGLTFDPARLEEIESRLAELRRLKKKYGPSLEDVINRLTEDEARLAAFDTWEEDRAEMESRLAVLESGLAGCAARLTARRRESAVELMAKVEANLATLGMAATRFIAVPEPLADQSGRIPHYGPNGADRLEFLISPNPGEPPKPLAGIASGGELSRIALALKTMLAERDDVSVLVFDEVDSGIGGEVAVSVGECLRSLSGSHQVFCVTHLASIAVRADAQFRVDKEIVGERTVTTLRRLEGTDREEEIARMLAGDPDTPASLVHAAELLRKASSPGREGHRGGRVPTSS